MRNSIIKYIVFSTLSIILVVSGIFFYVSKTRGSIEAQTQENLFEKNKFYAQLVEERHNAYRRNLWAIAKSLDRQGSNTPGAIRPVLEEELRSGLFERMGTIDTEGKAVTTDGLLFDMKHRRSFADALEGKVSFEILLSSGLKPSPLCIYLAPVNNGEKVVSIIFAVVSPERYTEGKEDLHQVGQLVITNEDGAIFYRSRGYLPLDNYATIIDFFNMNSGMEKLFMPPALQGKQGGKASFSFEGRPYVVAHWSIGEPAWWHVYFLVSEERLNANTITVQREVFSLLTLCGVLAILSLLVIFLLQRKHARRARRDKERLGALIENVPGGILSCTLDREQFLDFVSQGLLTQLGYDMAEFIEKTGCRFSGMLLPEDRERVPADLFGQIIRTGSATLEHRVLAADGRGLWFLTRGKRIFTEKGDRVYAVTTDITQMKRVQRELVLSQERHRIVTELSENIIFEHNLLERSFYLSPQFVKLFGTQPEGVVTFGSISTKLGVHPDDIPLFRELVRRTLRKQSEPVELRIAKKNKDYLWCRVQALSIFDGHNHPVRVVGSITNVDIQKRRAERLRIEAEQDALTGLANRNTTTRRIETCLATGYDDRFHALVVVDMNRFKEINNTLGHSVGDQVLVRTAEVLKGLLRDSDVAGRIGGDEFVILVRNLRTARDLNNKLDALSEQLRFSVPGSNIPISASIGVALFPQHGKSYIELFRHADIAMYQSKLDPQHAYVIYQPEIEHHEDSERAH